MNLGAKALSAIGLPSDVALKLGVDKSTVSRWQRGQRLPSDKQRAGMRTTLGIDEGSWDLEEPQATAVATAVEDEEDGDDELAPGENPDEEDDGAPATALARLREHLRQIDTKLDDGRNARDWATLAQVKTRALEVLAKLSGETNPSDEEKLARSATWTKMQTKIAAALKPYPAAAKAVAVALAS